MKNAKIRVPNTRSLFLGLTFLLVASVLSACQSDCDVKPSEKDFIDNGVSYFLSLQYENSTRFLGGGSKEIVTYKKYESLEDFYSTNPNCCTFSYIGQEGFIPSLIYRLKNDYEGTVIIRYPKLREIKESGIIQLNTPSRSVRMNGCAQAIDAAKGG
jgi:hypothetical protein